MSTNTAKSLLMKRIHSLLPLVLAILTGITVMTNSGHAFAVSDRDFQHAFRSTMQNPMDINAAMHYSELAITRKDYESAIPPLERILMFNPDRNDIRLQVGILYYLLESRLMAEEYLQQAKTQSTATQDQKTRADYYLGKL